MFKDKILHFISKEWLLILVILILATGTRFYYFGRPNQIVFDEVYFPKFATDYFKGEYYFDIHPPLAKLLMAGSAKLFGINLPVSFDFSNISKVYPDNSYKFLRFFVSIFGLALIFGVYFLAKELFKNKWPAFLAALLAIFENSILVQSRLILTDVFLLAFGVWGLVFLLMSRRKKIYSFSWFLFFILSILFLTAGFLVKWTALVFIGVAALIILINAFQNKPDPASRTQGIRAGFLQEESAPPTYLIQLPFIPAASRGVLRASNKKWKEFFVQAAIFLIVSFLFYFAIFAIHLKSLPYSGGGDAYMSQRFQRTLIGNQNYNNPQIKPLNLFGKFIELNEVMFSANAGLKATHSYGSKWYSWPVLYRPIYYWYGKTGCENCGTLKESRIYLLGNPFIWWLGGLIIIYWIFWLLGQFFKKRKNSDFVSVALIVAGYLGNLLPYVFVSRVSFLYHYFPSLLFLIIALGFFLWKYFKNYPTLILLVLFIVFVTFVFFAPLSYGSPLTGAEYKSRVWFPTWQ